MKLAFSGSAGTGKTTLARALAAELGVPYIAEGMRTWLEAGGDIHAVGRDGLRTLVLQLWDEQDEAEARVSACVVDRCAFDFVAFWTYYGFMGEDGTDRLLDACLRRDRYHTVWLCPWGAFPLEADGVRSSNRWVQWHVQTLIEGTLARAEAPVRHVRADTVAARLAEVLGR